MTGDLVFDPVQRVNADLLNTERNLRQAAQSEVVALRRLLVRVCYHLDGRTLEQAQEKNPAAPDCWTSREWAVFLDGLDRQSARPADGWRSGEAEALRRQNTALQKEVDELRRSLLEARQARPPLADTMPVEPARPQVAIVETSTVSTRKKEAGDKPKGKPKHALRLDIPWPGHWPEKPPLRFEKHFKQWERERLVLWVVAQGKGIAIEAQEIVASKIPSVSSGDSGSIERLFKRLVEGKSLTATQMRVENIDPFGSSTLNVVGLGDVGRDVCGALNWEARETEYERLCRLHDGAAQPEHSAAVLILTWHARRNGWRAEPVPDTTGNAKPDALLEKDGERVYVEVELGEDKPQKWKNAAELQGFVAVLAHDGKRRLNLENEIRALGLSGRATDIASLIMTTPEAPLFVSRW